MRWDEYLIEICCTAGWAVIGAGQANSVSFVDILLGILRVLRSTDRLVIPFMNICLRCIFLHRSCAQILVIRDLSTEDHWLRVVKR
jgi:hypothetical protein